MERKSAEKRGDKKPKLSFPSGFQESLVAELTETLVEQFVPENIPLDVVFEDESFIIINTAAADHHPQ